jgi:hypothetical protein
MKLPDLQEQARPTPTPAGGVAKYQPEDLGAAMAPGMAMSSVATDLGNEAAQWLAKEKLRADTMMVEDATTKLRAAQQDMKMGKQGFINIKGIDAVQKPLLQDYTKQFKDVADDLASNLTPDQQLLFRKRADVYGLEHRGEIMNHVMKEGDHAEAQGVEARINGEKSRAESSWNNGAAVATSIASIEGVIQQFGQARGWSEDAIKEDQKRQRGDVGASVVVRAIASGNLDYAKEMLTKFTLDMGAEKASTLKKQIEVGDKQAKVLTYSDEVFATVNGYKAQMKKVQEDFAAGTIDAATRIGAEQRIDHKRAVGEQMKNDGDKAMMGAAQEWVMKNAGKSVMEMPPNLYAWSKNSGHLAALDSFATREGRPGERVKELQVRGQMMNDAAADPDTFIAEFKRTGFADRMELGANGIKEMQNVAQAMIAGNGKYKSEFDQKIMQDAIPKELLSKSNQDKRDAFVGLQHEAMITWRKANPGKIPTIEDQKQVARSANAEYIDVGLWNTKAKAYELKDGNTDFMPVEMFNAMKAAGAKDREAGDFFKELKKRGATNQEIMTAWALKKGAK